MRKTFLVGLILLALLLSGCVDFIPSDAHAVDEVRLLLNSSVDDPGTIRKTKEIIFGPDDALPASALTSRINIATDQICMSTGQFESGENALFEWQQSEDGLEQRILYRGDGKQYAKIAITCNNSLELLLDDIDFYLLDYDEGNDIMSACESTCANKDKCCAIVLEKS